MKASWIITAKSAFDNAWIAGVYKASNISSSQSTVAVALWAMTPNVTITPNLQLVLDAVYDGGVGNVVTTNPKWSAQGRL